MSENSNVETMKADKAATKIQANFRGYRVRKQMKGNGLNRQGNREEQSKGGNETQSRVGSVGSILKRRDTREALEEKSATKIQAGIRGFLVRKRQQEAQAAATRIQAGFRGFRTRKLLKQNGQ